MRTKNGTHASGVPAAAGLLALAVLAIGWAGSAAGSGALRGSLPFRPELSGTFVDSGQALGQDANGVALGDLDGDGDFDAYVVHVGADRVWLNDGGGQFADSGQNLGAAYSLAVVLGDLDADGDLDAFVVEDDASGNGIWINQGGAQGGTPGVFAVNGQTIGDDLSSSVALGDVDGDGDLDAFVARTVGRPDKVWLNDGSGHFADSGQTLGARSGSGVALGDLDGDGDADALVADDTFNTLWVNQGGDQGGPPGVFLDSGQTLTGTLSIDARLADVDRDGDLDAVTANVNAANQLWINQGGAQGGTPGVLVDSGQVLGPANNRSAVPVDVDVDGDPDLFVARNGPNTVWINQGGAQGGEPGTYADSGQMLDNRFSGGVALADLDSDNDPDALVANLGPTQVWRNEGPSGLEVLYRVRDNVLAPTPRGQHYIALYYTFNPELLALVLAHPDLFGQSYETLVTWLPNLESLVDGQRRGDAVITAEQVQALDDTLTALSALGSPALQQAIADERAALPPMPSFVGMTMREARETVLGSPAAFLPIVLYDAGSGRGAAGPRVTLQEDAPQGKTCVLYCLFTGDCD